MLLRGEALCKKASSKQLQAGATLAGVSMGLVASKNEASKMLERIQKLNSDSTFVLKTVDYSNSRVNGLGSRMKSGSLKVVGEETNASTAKVEEDAAQVNSNRIGGPSMTIGPESLILQRATSSNRYEACVSISAGTWTGKSAVEVVRLKPSVAFLRLSKSQVMISTSCTNERWVIMLLMIKLFSLRLVGCTIRTI